MNDRSSFEAWLKSLPAREADKAEVYLKSRIFARLFLVVLGMCFKLDSGSSRTLQVWRFGGCNAATANKAAFPTEISSLAPRKMVAALSAIEDELGSRFAQHEQRLNRLSRAPGSANVPQSGLDEQRQKIDELGVEYQRLRRAVSELGRLIENRPLDEIVDAVESVFRVSGMGSRFSLWSAVLFDAQRFVGDGQGSRHSALFPGGPSVELSRTWQSIKSALASTKGLEDWDFWIDWYEAELAGGPMLPKSEDHWQLLVDIFRVKTDPDTGEKLSLLDESDWEKGSAHVNPIIREHYEKAKARFSDPLQATRVRPEQEVSDARLSDAIEAVSFPPRVSLNPRTHKLEAHEATAEDLSDVVKEVRNALREFTARCKSNPGDNKLRLSILRDYAETIELLRKDVVKFKERPFELHERLSRRTRAFQNIAGRERYQDDDAHFDLVEALRDGARDICALHPEVLAVVKQRRLVEAELASEEQRRTALLVLAGIHEDSSGVLNAGALWAFSILVRQDASPEEKRDAWHFLAAVAPRGAKELRDANVEPSTGKQSKSIWKRLGDAGDGMVKANRATAAAEDIAERGHGWSDALGAVDPDTGQTLLQALIRSFGG